MTKLQITCEQAKVSMTATLNQTDTAGQLMRILPIEGRAQTWGEEVYFEIPQHLPEKEPHAVAPPGTIAYWPPGHAFCIFFGQTPYSPVNILGMLDGDPNYFARVRSGDIVRLELIEK